MEKRKKYLRLNYKKDKEHFIKKENINEMKGVKNVATIIFNEIEKEKKEIKKRFFISKEIKRKKRKKFLRKRFRKKKVFKKNNKQVLIKQRKKKGIIHNRYVRKGRFYMLNTVFSLKKRLDITLLDFMGFGHYKTNRIKVRLGENVNRKKNFLNWVKRYTRLQDFLFYRMFYIEGKKGDKDRVSTLLREYWRKRRKSLQKGNAYRHVRFRQFLPVRGQRTKTNAQTQKKKRKNRKKLPIPKKKK